jgi:UDP-N-acetylmuramyl pentapeptide phosphotransferase/UDP-N-acetylglucosamine-1-phosphate transferase
MYGLFGIGVLPSWLGITLSIITVVYLINAVNLIDGVDGLAAGTSMLSLYLLSTLMGGGEFFFSFAFLGLGLIVFMGFNFSDKKKIFLGDAGSLGLGFVLATMAMEFLHSGNGHFEHMNLSPIVAAVLILGYPIADTLRVFMIRIATGSSPFIMACVGTIVLMNKTLAPALNSHVMIVLNIGAILLIHMFVRHRSVQLRIFWRSFSRAIFNPVIKVWSRYVTN